MCVFGAAVLLLHEVNCYKALYSSLVWNHHCCTVGIAIFRKIKTVTECVS